MLILGIIDDGTHHYFPDKELLPERPRWLRWCDQATPWCRNTPPIVMKESRRRSVVGNQGEDGDVSIAAMAAVLALWSCRMRNADVASIESPSSTTTKTIDEVKKVTHKIIVMNFIRLKIRATLPTKPLIIWRIHCWQWAKSRKTMRIYEN